MAVGDVVQLKSGGPKMTIEALKGEGAGAEASCVYFAGSLRRCKFPVALLQEDSKSK